MRRSPVAPGLWLTLALLASGLCPSSSKRGRKQPAKQKSSALSAAQLDVAGRAELSGLEAEIAAIDTSNLYVPSSQVLHAAFSCGECCLPPTRE